LVRVIELHVIAPKGSSGPADGNLKPNAAKIASAQ
jgi:hypothetical protein